MTVKFPEGLNNFYIEPEATPGTGETVAAGDIRYAENISADHKKTILTRTGAAPVWRGFKGIVGVGSYPLSYDTEIGPVTVEDANSRPICHPHLIACGFALTSSVAGDPKYLFYTRKTSNHGSATAEVHQGDETRAKYWNWRFVGFRADWTLDLPASEKHLLSLDGNAASGTKTLVGSALALPDYSVGVEPTPAIGVNNYIAITVVDTDAVYAGCVHSGSIAGNMGLTEVNTPECREVELRPDGGVTWTLTVEEVDDFNWYALRDAAAGLFVVWANADGNFTGTAPAATGDYVLYTGTFQITDIAPSADLRLNCLDVTLQEIWPDASDDGGLQPADGFQIIFVTKGA